MTFVANNERQVPATVTLVVVIFNRGFQYSSRGLRTLLIHFIDVITGEVAIETLVEIGV